MMPKTCGYLFALLFWFLSAVIVVTTLKATAQDAPQIQCPTPESCQVLVLTETEVKILTQENGILATAAQARNLDLGQYVSYFRQKLAVAPAGRPQPKPAVLETTPGQPQPPAVLEKK